MVEKFIKSENGIDIYLREDCVNDNGEVVLSIHGLAEHSGRYEDFFGTLNELGVNVISMDVRGHGKSGGKRGDLESVEKVLQDIHSVVSYIKNNHKFSKIVLFGHSMGGLLCALYECKYHDVGELVLSSPVCYLPKRWWFLKIVPCHLFRKVYIFKKHRDSQNNVRYGKYDTLGLKKYSLRTVGIMYKDGIKDLHKGKIACPTLLMRGEKDILFDEKRPIESFFANIACDDKKLVSYKESMHRIIQNENAKQHIVDIVDWIRRNEKCEGGH